MDFIFVAYACTIQVLRSTYEPQSIGSRRKLQTQNRRNLQTLAIDGASRNCRRHAIQPTNIHIVRRRSDFQLLLHRRYRRTAPWTDFRRQIVTVGECQDYPRARHRPDIFCALEGMQPPFLGPVVLHEQAADAVSGQAAGFPLCAAALRNGCARSHFNRNIKP